MPAVTSLFLAEPLPKKITVDLGDGIRHQGTLRPYSMRDDIWWATLINEKDPVEKGLADGTVIDIVALWLRLLDTATKEKIQVAAGAQTDKEIINWLLDLPAAQTNEIVAQAWEIRLAGMPNLPEKKKRTATTWTRRTIHLLIIISLALSVFIIWASAERIFYCLQALPAFWG